MGHGGQGFRSEGRLMSGTLEVGARHAALRSRRPLELTMFRIAAIAALLASSLSAAHAQGYPGKPIRLMIGYTAGGSAEAGARPLARALEPLLGQPLVFEYRPGNAGGVAMEAIATPPALPGRYSKKIGRAHV